MENALKETYGIIVYQEQVMQIGREVAGFTMAQRLDNTNSTVPQRGAIEKFTKQITKPSMGANKTIIDTLSVFIFPINKAKNSIT